MLDFTFKGTSASSLGVYVEEITPPPKPGNRKQTYTIPGRDGFVTVGDSSLKPILRTVTCFAPKTINLEQVLRWLDGSGTLLLSTDDGYSIRAKIDDGVEPDDADGIGYVITVPFTCQPYRYIHPAPAAQTVTTSGGTITNGGTKPSLPKITITATGDYTVTINGTPVQVTGGSVIIDSELMECFNSDGATLANSRVTLAEYPTLSVGSNSITWSGSVTSVAVLPRSRSL